MANTTNNLQEEQVQTALVIEAIITLLENSPILFQLLQRSGQLSPSQVNLYRERLRLAMKRLDKTWEDYLQEALAEQKGGNYGS